MTGDHGVLLEVCRNRNHACERLCVWAGHLRGLELHKQYGVFIVNTTGTGWTIRLGRHDMSAPLVSAIPMPRAPAE